MESVRTYHYTIKIAGDCDQKFLDMFKHNLSKFDPVKVEEPKTTPIQKNVVGFDDLENESVTIIKAEFKYPATEPMIQQCAQACGCNINRVRVFDTQFADGMADATEKLQNQYDTSKDKSLLMTTELEDNGKEASKEYASQYLDRVMPKKPSVDIPYAAPKTPTAPKTNKEEAHMSPMSKINRPEKPATGSRKASQ
jgi:hypothetical protein